MALISETTTINIIIIIIIIIITIIIIIIAHGRRGRTDQAANQQKSHAKLKKKC